MIFQPNRFPPRADRGPLKVMFMLTSMPVGGAETLLVNLVRKLDRRRFNPEVCCLKEAGPLGEELAGELPLFNDLICHKFDFAVVERLKRLLVRRKIDAVVTVGAGDKMFWGRLAAWRTGLPVVLSALHSTGWPDGVGKMNRMLTPITDGFIGVAAEHARYLVERERFPEEKVHVIPNGVDVQRFRRCETARLRIRRELGVPADAPVAGIVAALRPEKNHLLFLQTAALVKHDLPEAHFLIVGDGPQRKLLEAAAKKEKLDACVHFTGSRSDIPDLLAGLDLFALTSNNEANPVSILEAMACELPVVSTRVGSIAESVAEGETGYLTGVGCAEEAAAHWFSLLGDPRLSRQMGRAGRQTVVANWSLETMVQGYEDLIEAIYREKTQGKARNEQAASRQSPSVCR